MKEGVLYTGTFNPYHLGHFWQLERTYRAHTFDKAIIAVIKSNPKKPEAIAWQDRVELAKLMFADSKLPFAVELQTIEYVRPEDLKRFVDKYLKGYRVTRTVASDTVVELIEDKEHRLSEALFLFHYAIVVRPLVGQKELEKTLAKLPQKIADKFSYEIVHVQTEADVSATNIRKDPERAFANGYITRKQLDYIQQKRLYE